MLSTELQTLLQRSGSANNIDLSMYATIVRRDFASLIRQHNNVVYPLLNGLISEVGLDALDYGITGNVIYTHKNAISNSAVAFWDNVNNRPRSIKETVDVLLAELARLENIATSTLAGSTYDDTAIWAAVADNILDLKQLAEDTVGDQYTFTQTGNPENTYSLSQALDAIGSFFTGFPGTGNTYTPVYPSLALDQTVITDLDDHLNFIRDFIGMATVGPEMPTYSSNVFITDLDSLEESIGDLDAALASHASRHISGAADEVDGDHLDIDFTPTNYTPDTTIPEATTTAHLAAHLAGIDNALTSVSTVELGKQYIYPRDMMPHVETPLEIPPLETQLYGTSPNQFRQEYRLFSTSNIQTVYIQIAVPVDDAGNSPSEYELKLYTYGIDIDMPINLWNFRVEEDIALLEDGESMGVAWSLVSNEVSSGNDPLRLYILDFGRISINKTNPDGIIRLKITREVSPSPGYNYDVRLKGALITWFK